ncbi:MAG: pyrroline-5-carboxylate reductase [Promethearchaeia archaeon]
MSNQKLGIIGIGNMGNALLNGVINSNILPKDKVLIYDTNGKLLNRREENYNVSTATDNKDLVKKSNYVLLCVKPQVIDLVLKEIKPELTSEKTIISIAAGVTIDHVQRIIKKNVPIIRIMPNTPALVGEGAVAVSNNKYVKDKTLEFVKNVLNSVGLVVEIEEKYMDAVTGLSGSGPAYIFMVIEALADGGVKMGLSREVALELAAQTVKGAAKMVLDTKKHPGELKDMVASPGGTTITAIHELEKKAIRSSFIKAVESATLKSKSLK